MHPALRTGDILNEIFIHLRPSDLDRKQGNVTLYHAALVCKHFLPHALNALWFSMESLEPLCNLIPRNCASWGDHDIMFLTDLVKPEDLSTFDTYARRIQRYDQKIPAYRLPIRTPVVLELLECLHRRFLLPNLRYLKFETDGKAGDTYCFFFSPTLKEIEITFDFEDDDDDDILCLFPRLVRAAPTLQSFTVHSNVPDNIWHLIRNFTQLRTLDTENGHEITIDTFLSTFSFAAHLTTLRADSVTIIDNDDPLIKVKRLADESEMVFQYPVLKTLELRNMHRDIMAAAEVFSATLFPNLQDLVLNGCQYKDNESYDTYSSYRRAWCRFFTSVFSEDSRLQCLKIRDISSSTTRPSEDTGIKLSRLLEHATQHQPLVSLSLEVPHLQPLTSTSVQCLAKTFPHLKILSLVPQHDARSAIIKFQDLALLAQLLPKLSTLHVCIDGTDTSDPPKVPLLTHHLKTLRISRSSKIGSPFLFGRHITRIFPFASLDASAGLPPKGDILISALNMMKECRDDENERRVKTD